MAKNEASKEKKNVWPIIAGLILAIVVFATAGLLMKVAGLNMLPMKYLGLAGLAVVFILIIIAVFFFLIPGKAKKSAKYLIRGIGVLLAVSLVAVDVVGIQMVNKFEETMKELNDGADDEVKVEEFVIGVYVRVDDKAESLEDVKRYDIGYSLSYDRNNTRKAISVIENDLDRNLKLEEYNDIFEMVDKVLAKEKDAFILSAAYMDIIEGHEGYSDISDKVKCIHECVVTT